MIRRERRQTVDGAFLDVHRQLQNNDFDSNNPTQYPIENISRGGLRFQSTETYRVDERIEIIVKLPNGNTHSAMARICYFENDDNDNSYYGVSFLDNFLEMAKCI